MAGFATGISSPVDLAVGADGSLYYLARGAGAVYRVRYGSGTQAPTITMHPASQSVTVGQSATFSVAASGTVPLSYRWQRNGVDIAGATASTYTIPSATTADNGARFRAIVSNSAGSATSNEATLTVTSNRPPTASITQPLDGTLYAAGDTVFYGGTGTDPEDGNLPPSAFTWRVDFHHDDHVHPFIASTTGASSGWFTIPREGETSANVWYRIHLTVRDSAGLTHSTFRDLRPRTVSITLSSVPSGMQLTLDGQPVTAPYTFTGVVGMKRTIGAPSPQTLNSISYQFASWSDGGAATHDITTPASATTYTATFNGGTGGGGSARAEITDPPPGSTLSGSTVTFAWSAGSGVSQYWLYVGTTGVGSANIHNQSHGTNRSATVGGLPANGGTVYVRLWSLISNTWQYNDYQYTAAGGGTACSFSIAPTSASVPAGGGTGSVSVTTAGGCNWTAASNAAWITVTSGASGSGNGSVSYSVAGNTGSSMRSGTLTIAGQTFTVSQAASGGTGGCTAPERAAITSPPPGSTLSGGSATFTWIAGCQVSYYWLNVGTVGAGSSNLYSQVHTTNRSATITNLPTSGTIYLRLWSNINGAWQYDDYQYTAAP